MKFKLKNLDEKDLYFCLKVTPKTLVENLYEYIKCNFNIDENILLKCDGEVILRKEYPLRKYFDIKSEQHVTLYFSVLENNEDSFMSNESDESDEEDKTVNDILSEISESIEENCSEYSESSNLSCPYSKEFFQNHCNLLMNCPIIDCLMDYVDNYEKNKRNNRIEKCINYTLFTISAISLAVIAYKLE